MLNQTRPRRFREITGTYKSIAFSATTTGKVLSLLRPGERPKGNGWKTQSLTTSLRT